MDNCFDDGHRDQAENGVEKHDECFIPFAGVLSVKAALATPMPHASAAIKQTPILIVEAIILSC